MQCRYFDERFPFGRGDATWAQGWWLIMSAQGTREETELPASVAHARVSMSAAAQRNASHVQCDGGSSSGKACHRPAVRPSAP